MDKLLETTNIELFHQVYNKYSKLVYSVALHIVLSKQEAEEVVQDVFIKYCEHFNKIEKVEDPKYWLTKVTTNLCIDKYNRSKRFDNYSENPEHNLKTNSFTITTKIAVKEELQGILWSLNEKDRSILILKLGQDCNYREISDILGIPEGTVKSTLSRLLTRIKNVRKES